MASSSNMRASKLRSLAAEAETTVGTYKALSSLTNIIPVIGFPTADLNRGKQMIDRVATTDGQSGAVASIRGSSAWSASYEMELHDSASKYNYWVQFLLACGFELVNLANTPSSGQNTARLTLSNKVFADFDNTDTDHAPTTMSCTVLQNNNGVDDYAMRMRGCTGVASFNLATGDIAKLSVAMKGLVVTAASDDNDLLDNSDVDVANTGNLGNWNTPFVVKNIVLTITDADSNEREICVQSIGINMNSNHPDFECPVDEYGFEISPVFHDASPTVDLAFPDGATVQPWVFAQFRSGATFSVTATLQSATGRNITFNFPALQFQTVTLGDSGGFVNYTVNTKAVRDPGATAGNIMNIDYVWDATS